MKRISLVETLGFAALLSCVPLRRAFAYVDPNSAGALYQLLFPLLIAIGAAFAAIRRIIARACSRIVSFIAARVRGRRAADAATPGRPSEHAD
jgi:hypothetical protein